MATHMMWILLIVVGIVALALAGYICLVVWFDLTRTLTEYAEGARHERD